MRKNKMPTYLCKYCNKTYKDYGLCPECNSLLETQYTIKEVVHMGCVEDMARQVKDLGAKKVWELIERNYHNPEQRGRVRSLFLEALKKLGIDDKHFFTS